MRTTEQQQHLQQLHKYTGIHMKYVFNAGLFIHSTRQHKATQQQQEQHKSNKTTKTTRKKHENNNSIYNNSMNTQQIHMKEVSFHASFFIILNKSIG